MDGEKLRRLVEDLEREIECSGPTPSQFKPWLRKFLETRMEGDPREFIRHDIFLRGLRRVGLIRAVLYNINENDADYKERRRGAWNHLPDFSLAWPVIRHVLDNEEEDSVRTLACKWVSDYAPNRETAVAVLTKALRWRCRYAALQLSRLAPDTPGVVEVLADALDHEWIAYNCQSYDNGVGGAGEAAVALRRMGIRARPALARLRAAVMSERDDWSSSTDRWLAFEAYVAIGGDDAEIGNLLDQLAARGTVREQFVEGVARLAQGNNSLLPHLSRLQQTIRKNKGECTP
jgi:hypothetical protein